MKKGNVLVCIENAVCPHCGSLERSRLLKLFLENETKIFNDNPKILHFAPEDSLKNILKANPNYQDVDLNPNLASLQMDITDLKFSDNTFDFIICAHVLGHIPDEKKALSEMYRVLKSGGKLFLLSLMNLNSEETLENFENNTPEKKLKAYGEFDLQRLYGLDFENRLQSKQVVIKKIDYRKNFGKAEREKCLWVMEKEK
ncbi:class I SAM-dependent methyltransferase [Frigoriflavimonas asaccharolytica]|uniref:SAM-dependent methyltransferase n=1 Tax=Frigoriflavimonas asaccharolytica TaxID=2735899 RepID=A0A8J8K4A9_9FLAO|nr:class I SAM-dependent methyltransferase [Frigoriflavimonas asaccharolytica]NRS91500.1 SAM-dependent methyltransferase [Frigoriflavimonas asaccharolytica]